MDLHYLDATPTEAERAAVDALLGSPEGGNGLDPGTVHGHGDAHNGGHPNGSGPFPAHGAAHGNGSAHGNGTRDGRDMLLPALHAVHDRIGWISQGALNHICRQLSVPPADAYGVASFYALFALRPRPSRVLHVCTDLACKANGSSELCDRLEQSFGPAGTAVDGMTWQHSPCLGACERAPAALAFEAGDPARTQLLAPAGTDEIEESARSGPADADREPPARESVPQAGDPELRLLHRVGVVDPDSLDDYRAHGGYIALRNALRAGPAEVIKQVTDAKLMGRGGAAFPTGRKWDSTASQPVRPHYLVCNADESEPGTFKDRILMEGDPFSVIESMTIAGFATGCAKGYLYIRGEYPRATRRLANAIAQARERGFLGRSIMGHEGVDFDIEIRRGAGAYICGEETALFNSIEGYRGEPRSKPPLPVEEGLFGKPTVVNNVETLVNVPLILIEGGEAYARIGTERSTGTRLFCLSGTVARPGLYEVPFGTTLRELLDLAGGVPEERTLRAVLLGGAAGGFVRPGELDLPLTMEGAQEAGTTLGSGVVLVFDDTVNLPAMLLRIASFFRDESCGQCVPCRVGTVRQEEALQRMAGGKAPPDGDDLALLREVGQVMRDSSICGLGQTAWNAVESAIDRLGTLSKGGPA
ncbi:NAD-dependent formate dehydrogenase flavoprotein subunit [Halopolyspora algeriensis]|uniref:NAD-dependent formate dehydrogenase flavoprotein subunit n=1 Tax=Halopolyspora algeriensis TaxID=1500506 RepID=A0A368VC75_9ACTN|nr:NAD(P)H-dependent oxidoreductase subunit E [Halopolyspora algeriensis]RCW38789.1 NAD-dependent formate dehydrogenase flavoprotein subunit [Halopolyspora algeriensis]TQM55715.1 NAD-dependent formate dehydrogenase flavoprotein subunit [Halopolyspora algeriensis]